MNLNETTIDVDENRKSHFNFNNSYIEIWLRC